MKIKTKLRLGIGLLFAMITVLAVVGIRQVSLLSADSRNILIANHNSLEYSRQMLRALDELQVHAGALDTFKKNLEAQQKNITEIGEKELTEQLTDHFEKLKMNVRDREMVELIRNDALEIMSINLDAINRKSQIAGQTAKSSMVWIGITGTLCFIIAFTLFVNLPGNIANPIRELTESIRQIANENYTERVHFGSGDEYGQLAQSFNTMAEKLEEYNSSNLARLMIEKKRVETLIDNMHDPVIGLDENRKVIFANEVARKVTGLQVSELVGRNAMDIALHNDLVRSLVKDISDPQARGKGQGTAMKIYADDKESYFEKEYVDISIVPTGEQQPRSIGHVIILRNVTPYKELDFAKTNFIANVSHELKTPISSIKITLDLLRNERVGDTNEEQRSLLDSIREDADRLLKITGELLNITQVESGKIQLNIAGTSPREIVQYAIAANETQAESRDISLQIEDRGVRSSVLADSEKTAWVVTNLVSNAIRYSYDHSSIRIILEEDPESVRIAVADNGQGISQEYKDKIFDRYFRVPGSTKEGTGLGLAISREFMEAQDGTLTVESELGAGSTFTIALKKSA
ncbi:PAS domain-containing sensor histidine kinase [Dyadobacter endophyticus]|uniref:histidine kinase n=1 Tax=Dyadobacter endophyticus TaxID=1749036 RepID=A0ABQ1YGF5_9BACT|nr:ATP-binding protein [Dyadobacter endophyticus]GGH23735.1 PAS domain-containing sensor histidine kinase [Dyadobacter endophyticus]